MLKGARVHVSILISSCNIFFCSLVLEVYGSNPYNVNSQVSTIDRKKKRTFSKKAAAVMEKANWQPVGNVRLLMGRSQVEEADF